jgi:hypothetical protein
MGNFDEMFFRSLVDEGEIFPSALELETVEAHTSFLSETNYYLYGGRFVTFLVAKYGTEKVFQWYKDGASFQNFKSKFADVFGMDFSDVWGDFIEHEKEFQRQNLQKLKTVPLTFSTRLSGSPSGSVTQPHFRAKDGTVLWGQHKPDHLASFVKFNVRKRISREIETLRAPSMFQVASTAYDESRDMLFYTTKNNQLYRDLWMLDVRSGESRLLFEDSRVGHLTMSAATHELWGIRHGAGVAQLVCLRFPYRKLEELVYFDFGDEVQGLAVSPAGDRLAAVLHKVSGEQSLVLVEIDKLKSGNNAPYTLISGEGSPENPSWSRDGKTVYWNAYTNGVSNIYRKRIADSTVVAVTHTLRGFFKPLELDRDALFAFEFSSAGFLPVIVPNRKAEKLPAIAYLGQEVQQKFPMLTELKVDPKPDTTFSQSVEYNALSHVEVASIFPVVSGFQKQKMLGLFGHFSDPILDHDCTIEMGVSPFGESQQEMRFHLKLKYEYRSMK